MTKPAEVPVLRAEPSTQPVTAAEIDGAALVFAREVRAHVQHGLAQGRLEAVLAAGRQAEHLIALVGLTQAAHAFAMACREETA